MSKLIIITRLPLRANLFSREFAVVLNQKYKIEEANNFFIENATEFKAVPIDSFEFIAEVDGTVSQNSATCFINFETASGIPDLFELTHDAEMSDTLIFTDYVTYQNTFDRILIDSVQGKGAWRIEGEKVKEGDVYFYYEIFEKMVFFAEDPGAQDNYSELNFFFSDVSGVKGVLNSFKINTSSKAYLVSDQIFLDKSTDEIKIKEFSFSIENQIVNKSFDITVETNIASIALEPENGVYISNDLGSFETHTNGNSTISDVNPDQEGRIFFKGSLRSKTDFDSADFIKITLNEIDGDPNLVDLTKNILTFNI